MRTTAILLLTAATALADPNPGEEGTPEHRKAAELVQQLGHPRYATREAAAKALLDMGPAALPALTAGTKAADEEVRNRSMALLPQVKALEWKRRADDYLADADGKRKHDLPLLGEWEKLIGQPDEGSRKLFADMVRTNGEFLETVAANRGAARAPITARVRNLHAQLKGPKGQIKGQVGDLAAVLFADAVRAPRRVDWSERPFPAQLLKNPAWPEVLDARDTGPVLRRLLVKWMESRRADDHQAFQQFASLARTKPMPEAAPILTKTAKDPKQDALTVRVLAVQALGKMGTKEAADTLAGLVSDTTQLFGGGTNEPRLGDAALAASLTMHGKKLSEFGLTNNYGIGFGTGDDNEFISVELHGFRSDEARQKALEKWKKEVVEAGKKKDEPGKK